MKTHPEIANLLFDWDGTLVDSAHLGLTAFQKTFADLEVAFPLEVYEAAYSPNWYLTYEALGLPRDKWSKADELWQRHYGEGSAELLEGVGKTLVELKRKGYGLGVVSSGNKPRVCREVERSMLAPVFAVIICSEDIVNKKPHPEGLELALKSLGSDPRSAAYIGDAPEDIEMGKAAGVFTIAVRSSYPSSSRVLEAQPDMYLDALPELLDHF